MSTDRPRCPACEGTLTLDGLPCRVCDGTGTIEADDGPPIGCFRAVAAFVAFVALAWWLA